MNTKAKLMIEAGAGQAKEEVAEHGEDCEKR
jgi:hypothetical protein